ncbi:hypothetical protein NQ318_008045 [Aromia moschata]|uniref:Uncharacterized protein n=1 Tax=Aromia moschata TaxID=1265417 RepID=A0AAV8X7Q3_9CUCU|nr:hypothetical protein NQ318_008045 [Aromia moschata]
MESLLRCYFHIFNEFPRNSLHDRRKRENMVDYISTLIEACSAVEGDTQESCRIAIQTIISYHEEMRSKNGKVCMLGKYHNILYVAVKLCYVWQLKDVDTVSLLLEHIYSCERTFERIQIGAIFGNMAPHYVAGWKCDFDSQEENLRAVVYFLDKANKSRLELPFDSGNGKSLYRFIDLPIESCAKASPLKLAVELGLPDKLLIFLRFGATVHTEHGGVNVFEHLLNRLSEFNHVYPYNLVSCLQLLLRVVPVVHLRTKHDTLHEEEKTLQELISDRYSDLVDDGILPLSRCGLNPP